MARGPLPQFRYVFEPLLLVEAWSLEVIRRDAQILWSFFFFYIYKKKKKKRGGGARWSPSTQSSNFSHASPTVTSDRAHLDTVFANGHEP